MDYSEKETSELKWLKEQYRVFENWEEYREVDEELRSRGVYEFP